MPTAIHGTPLTKYVSNNLIFLDPKGNRPLVFSDGSWNGVWTILKKPIHFSCGNFVERADGAIFIKIDTTTAYYSHNKLIAIMYDNVLYREREETRGPIYKRIHTVMRHTAAKKTKFTTGVELKAMLEVAIMNMASRLIDDRLGIHKT
jgi:hypothetical protein